MAQSGPKPLPRNIVALRGSKDAIGKTNGLPEPEVVIPDPPDDMTDAAKAAWLTFAKQLAGMRVMTKADVASLQMLCETWARWKEATKDVTKNGFMLKSPNGYPIQNPMLAVANKAQAQCLALLAEFGLTPSSRSRIRQDG